MDSDLVQEILQELENGKIKSEEEIKQELKISLYQIYQPFLNFETNQENFRETFQKLEGYRLAEEEDMLEGRFIRPISSKYFYDIKLLKGGFISQVNNKKKMLTLLNGSRVTKINYGEYTIYLKMNEEEIVKMKIMDRI